VLETLRPERRLPYSGWWAVVAGALAGLAMRLVFWGAPDEPYSAMLASFIVGSPLVVGIVTVYIAELSERRTWTYYFLAPVIATTLYVLGSLAILVEGLICAIVIVPLFALVGGFAGLLMGVVCRVTNWPRRTVVSCVAALPLIAGSFEHRLPSANLERAVDRELYVDAPPDAVWRALVDTRDIRSGEVDSGWMHRIGVPLPTGGAGDFRDGEHLRHVTMGKGIHFDQVATEWLPNERVSWRYRFSADSIPPAALDDHVRIGGAYFDLGETTYALKPEGAGTRLSGRFRYRVSTNFNWYAAPVANLLIGDGAEKFLEFYAARATANQAAGS
jgi:uncharacterized protein YndB with AHSA1/START domain